MENGYISVMVKIGRVDFNLLHVRDLECFPLPFKTDTTGFYTDVIPSFPSQFYGLLEVAHCGAQLAIWTT